MKKLLSLILLTIFLTTAPVVAQSEATKREIEKTINTLNSKDKPALVYFYSKWCHSCRELSPTIHSVEKKLTNKYNFVYINTDKPYSVPFAGHYGVNVIPKIFIHDTKNSKIQPLQIYSTDSKVLESTLNKYYSKNYSK